MNYEQNYTDNLEALKVKNPSLHQKLSSLTQTDRFEVFEIPNEGFDILDKATHTFIHDAKPNSLIEEKYKLFDDTWGILSFTYHFGIGNGKYLHMLSKRPHMYRIVIIEPELEILYLALHLNNFSDEILKDLFVIFLSHDFDYPTAAMLFMASRGASIFAKLYTLDFTAPYYEQKSYKSIEINRYIIQAIIQSSYSVGNDIGDTLLGVKQHIANLKKVIRHPSLRVLESSCKNTDLAVIVATGPSLAKQLPKLKKIQKYVTIFCVDASLPILSKEKIQPDVVLSLERGPEVMALYERADEKICKKAVFALTSLVHPDVSNATKGGKISYSFRNYSYMRFFKLPDYGRLGRGASVANMAYELIIQANFKRCVLIGQDLAFGEDGKSHAKGHIFGEEEIADGIALEYVEKYGGGGLIKTNLVWKLFKNYYEEEIAKNKELGVETINATEGGARIHGAVEISFDEVIQNYVDQSQAKKPIKLLSPSKKSVDTLCLYIDRKLSYMLTLLKELKKDVGILYKETVSLTQTINATDAFIACDPKLYEDIEGINKQIDALKSYILCENDISKIIETVINTSTTRLERETAVLFAKPMKTARDKEVFQLQWPFMHREWLKEIHYGVENMLYAIGLGLILQKNDVLLEKFYMKEEIKFLEENGQLFDFPQTVIPSVKE